MSRRKFCKNRLSMKIYLEDIAEAVGISVAGVQKAKERGEFDITNLQSIAYFIVKRTISQPPEVQPEKPLE